MKIVNVVAAVIQYRDLFLCVQRGESKFEYISRKYEFPGGKIEADESEESALLREIKEELNKSIVVGPKLITVDHDYPDFEILMHTYLCFADDQDLQLSEHIDFKWLPINRMQDLDWAAADIPILNKLIDLNAANSLPQR
ncbi:MAG: (deoxy)nucleoside triphosphate pyrophosphohydrolase [Chitinophagaceae bacterium]|nr:MAG: (deoxy)nucleoside triphosphate pyrophosphohydrolase [Chitinophagaceae bacterium]